MMRTAVLIFGLIGLCGAQTLPGTAPLTATDDLASRMVSGIDAYLMREAVERKPSANASLDRFRKIVGLIDARAPVTSLSLDATLDSPALLLKTPLFEVLAVRWRVLDGVDAEGLLLKPTRPVVRNVVAIPDADQTPEQLAVGAARRLAENGCQVLIPTIIDRRDTWSGNPRVGRMTNQPHREFIYRMAFEMGRHIIGYEVQKVLAAVDYFAAAKLPIGVYGTGEGGLIALYSAAADARIERAMVQGYFHGGEQQTWAEPIYRNVWDLLPDFSDRQLVRLIEASQTAGPETDRSVRALPPSPRLRPTGRLGQSSPSPSRKVIVVAGEYPVVAGPPAERNGRRGASAGKLEAQAGGLPFESALGEFLGKTPVTSVGTFTIAPRDADGRMERQFRQLVDFTQRKVRDSEAVRLQFAAGKSQDALRSYFWNEIEGKLEPTPGPSEKLAQATELGAAGRERVAGLLEGRAGPARAFETQTRLLYDEPAYRGYEVTIPVAKEVFAYGILLLPKNLKPGERRPVVVAQHGLEDRPQMLVNPQKPRELPIYQRYAAQLAERGFIVYAPQNPYIFLERFRVLVRKGNPLKLSLYSFIIAQHQRTLEWLQSRPEVDGARIGFYGLSYGGKTGMRIPAVLTNYALSIVSGDFNEWISKVASVEIPFGYMFNQEYDMLEFDLGNTFNYSELAGLIAPRPFMVERGHNDGVGSDEMISYEYAKVRRMYANLGLAGSTEMEFFMGPHQIHAVGTFAFLGRHFWWPE